MSELISVCVPSRNRPDLLEKALKSTFAQDHRPIEILIGDDSDGEASGDLVADLRPPEGITVSYERNRPILGQAGNVNRLFDRAAGPRLLLLHDDDLLCPHGLDHLVAAWRRHPGTVCVYGRQQIIASDGRPLPAETMAWNERYFRVAGQVGSQANPLVAALWQQVPNNCFLVDSAVARGTRYRPEAQVGHCVDAEFAVRLALASSAETFVFIDEPVSCYRLTPISIARERSINKRQDLFFKLVEAISGDAAVQAARDILLRRISEGAALDAAIAGRRRTALGIIFSRFYDRRLFNRWTLYRLASALSPSAAAAIKRVADRYLPAEPIAHPGARD